MKILLVCERLGERDDEGIRNLARCLLERLAERHDVLALTQHLAPPRGAAAEPRVAALPMNRFFLNAPLLRRARDFAPDTTLYVPWTSGTLPTFWRARMLRLATRRPVALFLTQPYDNPSWQSWLIRHLLPELALGLSDTVVRHLAQLGAETELVPAGVDLRRFRLPSAEARAAQRRALGVDASETLVLHVGHLNRSRLDAAEIRALARRPGLRFIVVGSTSTPQDRALIRDLESAGCRVIADYLERVEDLYAAADVYLFPTREQRSSIGIPLSVLEALACGVPVVSTRFEGLPRLFPATPFVRFASSTRQLERALAEAPPAGDPGARALVESLDWSRIGEIVESHLLGLCRRSNRAAHADANSAS